MIVLNLLLLGLVKFSLRINTERIFSYEIQEYKIQVTGIPLIILNVRVDGVRAGSIYTP